MVSASVAEMDVQPSGDSKDLLGIFFHLELMIFCIHTISYRHVTCLSSDMENASFPCRGCDHAMRSDIQQAEVSISNSHLDFFERTMYIYTTIKTHSIYAL